MKNDPRIEDVVMALMFLLVAVAAIWLIGGAK
jgi:hypothetical protein